MNDPCFDRVHNQDLLDSNDKVPVIDPLMEKLAEAIENKEQDK